MLKARFDVSQEPVRRECLLKRSWLRMALALAPICCFALSACAPKVQSLKHEDDSIQTGPQLQDPDLHLDGKTPVAARIDFSGDVSSATVDRFTENIFSLQGAFLSDGRVSWAKTLLAGMPHHSLKLSQSAYADLMISQVKPAADEALAGILPKLKAQPALIHKLVTSLQPTLGAHATLDQMSKATFQFFRSFDTAVAAGNFIPQVQSGIHAQLQPLIAKEAKVNADLKALNSATTIASALDSVNQTASEFGFTIPSATQAKMNSARALGRQADAVVDAPSALTLLIVLWNSMSATERQQVFNTINPDLYNYLLGQSADDLKCLADPTCSGIAKSMVILPKIEAYGAANIRQMVNSRGAAEVKAEVADAAAPEIRSIPGTIDDKIEKSIATSIQPIVDLQSDFGSAIRSRIDDWTKATIEKNGPAIYQPLPAKAHLRVNSQGQVNVTWTELQADTLENTGSLESMVTFLWQGSGIANDQARSLLLLDLSRLAKTYNPTSLTATPDFASQSSTISAKAYAETIRGASALAISLRDWHKNSFEELLGSFTAQDLFPELKLPVLQQPIFPKGSFFALSFSDLADKLRLTTGAGTQVFVVDSQNHVSLANQIDADSLSASSSAAPVMAGIADRVGGQLSSTVRSEDVSRYLISMCQTLDAMSSIEESTSPYLSQPGKDGQVPRDEIIQNRDKIRMLVLGLANYLSHQFRAGGEMIQEELDITTQIPTSQSRITVLNQALAIRALATAADTLGIELYRWEAVDLVSALNRNLYRPDLGFYARVDEPAVSPVALLETLRALDAVQPYLKPFSRHQIELVTAPWRQRVSQWKLSSPDADPLGSAQ